MIKDLKIDMAKEVKKTQVENKPVEKGSVNITLTVAGWVAGATYDETI